MMEMDAVNSAGAQALEWTAGLDAVLAAAEPHPPQERLLCEFLGCAIGCDVRSAIHVPPFDNSAMDGFAVRAQDTAPAREGAVPLRVTGTSAAGAPFGGSVGAGEAVEIMTGALMPRGADAVVRVEDTQRPNAQTVLVTVPVACGTSVRLAGGDTRAGDMVAARGDVVTSGRIALCATCGIARAPVHPRPRIAVCTGGDEVVDAGSGAALAPGEIYDSNSPMLLARLREWGFPAEFLGRLPDAAPALRSVFEVGLGFDILVTTGGVSMGKFDLVRGVLSEMGCTEVFWRLNQQPGGPLVFARRDACLVFGLPGNPVAALVCADIYLKPALLKCSGRRDFRHLTVPVRLAGPLAKAHGKTAFVRGVLSVGKERRLLATSTGRQDSNLTRSVAAHDGYIVFPAGARELAAGNAAQFIVTNTAAFAMAAAETLGAAPDP